MVDTVRTRAALVTLLADNTTGQISAQDVRDLLISLSMRPQVNLQTGTTYTLVITDEDAIVSMNNASANTLTIPTNASVAFPVGSTLIVVMRGAGTTTVQGDTGVSLNGVSAGGATIDGQFKAVSLYKESTDSWIMMGAHGTVA